MKYQLGTLFIKKIPGIKYPRNCEDLVIFEVISSTSVGNQIPRYRLKFNDPCPSLRTKIDAFFGFGEPEITVERSILVSENRLKNYKLITQEIRDQILLVNKAERKYTIEQYRLRQML